MQWYKELVQQVDGIRTRNTIPAVGTYDARANGLQLLRSARRVVLERLMRAKDDEAFVEVQKHMRDTHKRHPVPPMFVEGLRQLSAADIANDPEWRFAPVGVVSRHERDVINASQATAFARAFEQPLITWKLKLLMSREMLDADNMEERLYADEPGLWGRFVRGAPIHLTENIRPVRKLVNGSPALLHSLLLREGSAAGCRRCVEFDSEGRPVAWERCTLREVCEQGGFQLVVLDQPPDAVNVTVGGVGSPPGEPPGSAAGSVLWHGCELDDLSELVESVSAGEQVIPLFTSRNVREGIDLFGTVAAQEGLPRRVQAYEHAYSLAFAMTGVLHRP